MENPFGEGVLCWTLHANSNVSSGKRSASTSAPGSTPAPARINAPGNSVSDTWAPALIQASLVSPIRMLGHRDSTNTGTGTLSTRSAIRDVSTP